MPAEFIVGGEAVATPFEVEHLLVFDGRRRRGSITEALVHESVTASSDRTVSVLKRRGLGVHVMIEPSGMVVQTGDLWARLGHAGAHNRASVGVEVINPYYPDRAPPGGPWSAKLDAKWAHRGLYLVPTMAQLESCAGVLRWLFETAALDIPRVWTGWADGKLPMGRVASVVSAPGIWAHSYFHHADGAFPVLYSWLRIEGGRSPEDAYMDAQEIACSASKRLASVGGEAVA